MIKTSGQSRSQGPQAFLSAVGRLEGLWDSGMEVRQDFSRKAIGRYVKQPIIKKDISYSSSPESLPATNRWQKRLRTLGSRLSSGSLQHQKSAIHGLIVKSRKSDWLKIQHEPSAYFSKNLVRPEVSILGADQKDRGLWGWEWLLTWVQSGNDYCRCGGHVISA